MPLTSTCHAPSCLRASQGSSMWSMLQHYQRSCSEAVAGALTLTLHTEFVRLSTFPKAGCR